MVKNQWTTSSFLSRIKFSLPLSFLISKLISVQPPRNTRSISAVTTSRSSPPSSLTRNTFCRTWSLSNATFSFLITWRSSSSKTDAVYKIHENRMIFHWDMAIYRFSKWRPSAILELFYHHTRPPTKSLLLAAAACQISCQSDTQIWRYSYLKCSHIWLQMPIQAPKMGVLGDFGPLNVIIHHRDPKRHILA